MELSKELKKEIWEYCRANNITNIDDFTLKLVKQGFTVEKFGATPEVKMVEKVVERIVEVPTPVTDDEVSQALKKALDDLKLANARIEELQKELTAKKSKPNKDLYGEN